mgnify:CR=1 FL=1
MSRGQSLEELEAEVEQAREAFERYNADALRGAGRWVGHVHFADSNRRAIGFGHTDIAPIAAALKDIGYAGYLSAEIIPLPDAATAAAQTMASFRKYILTSVS